MSTVTVAYLTYDEHLVAVAVDEVGHPDLHVLASFAENLPLGVGDIVRVDADGRLRELVRPYPCQLVDIGFHIGVDDATIEAYAEQWRVLVPLGVRPLTIRCVVEASRRSFIEQVRTLPEVHSTVVVRSEGDTVDLAALVAETNESLYHLSLNDPHPPRRGL